MHSETEQAVQQRQGGGQLQRAADDGGMGEGDEAAQQQRER